MTVRVETNVDFEIEAPLDSGARAKNLIRDFLATGCYEQVTIHSGFVGVLPAIVVEFLDHKHVLYASEARQFATALEKTMHQFPDFHLNGAVANLIMGMRLGADEAEAAKCQVPSTS